MYKIWHYLKQQTTLYLTHIIRYIDPIAVLDTHHEYPDINFGRSNVGRCYASPTLHT